MLSKLTRFGSIFFKSSPKIKNLSSSRFFSLSLNKPSLSLNVSRFSSLNNYSPLFSTTNLNFRFYSSGNIGKEMEAFLNEEIKAEKASSKPVKSIPGFEVKADGAMVELTRKFKDEKIRIRLNVNGSTTDEDTSESVEAENVTPGPLLSKPSFSIEITKPSGKTLCLSCNFSSDMNQFDEENQSANPPQPPSNEDIFEIEALTVLDKPEEDLDDNIYMGDASLIDGQLYDILMDYLDERGIGKEFASHLIDYCTGYEHERYIKLLEDLKSFVA